MRPEDYSERKLELEGWPVRVTSYKIENEYHCTVDNVSPGAWIARSIAATKQEAEDKALAKARERLARTHRHIV